MESTVMDGCTSKSELGVLTNGHGAMADNPGDLTSEPEVETTTIEVATGLPKIVVVHSTPCLRPTTTPCLRPTTTPTTYGALNSSSALIILNNRQRQKGCSHLRAVTDLHQPAVRFVPVDPRRHFRDHALHCCDITSRSRMKGHPLAPLAKRPFIFRDDRSYSWRETSEILHTARSSVNPRRHRLCQPPFTTDSTTKRSKLDLYARNPYATKPTLVRYDTALSTSSKSESRDSFSDDYSPRRLKEVTLSQNAANHDGSIQQSASPWFLQSIDVARKVYQPLPLGPRAAPRNKGKNGTHQDTLTYGRKWAKVD